MSGVRESELVRFQKEREWVRESESARFERERERMSLRDLRESSSVCLRVYKIWERKRVGMRESQPMRFDIERELE